MRPKRYNCIFERTVGFHTLQTGQDILLDGSGSLRNRSRHEGSGLQIMEGNINW